MPKRFRPRASALPWDFQAAVSAPARLSIPKFSQYLPCSQNPVSSPSRTATPAREDNDLYQQTQNSATCTWSSITAGTRCPIPETQKFFLLPPALAKPGPATSPEKYGPLRLTKSRPGLLEEKKTLKVPGKREPFDNEQYLALPSQ